MNPKALLFIVLVLTILSACDRRSKLKVEPGRAEPLAVKSSVPPPSNEIERKLIKEGTIGFESTSIQSTRKVITDAVTLYKGYISSDQESNYPGRTTQTLVVRIPTSDFDNFLKAATAGVEKFENKEIELKDVTEEFLDVQARLKTKKELESRYHELLKLAKSVTEILEIEKEIGTLRADLESLEGRLKYLENRVSLSILTITFYESVPNHSAFGQKFKEGIRNGWDNLIAFFILLLNIWPFVVAGVVVFFIFKRFRRRAKANKT